jgi:hypothetical protein
MNASMRLAHSQLAKLLEANELTAGMYVRVHGDNLIIGRRELEASAISVEDDDRVRLTRLGACSFGLSVRRHTGRWERTPFSGTLDEMVQVILTLMQHLVAPSPGCTRTSGQQH